MFAHLLLVGLAFATPVTSPHEFPDTTVSFAKDKAEEDRLWNDLTQEVTHAAPGSRVLFNDETQISALWIPHQEQDAPLFILSSGIHGTEAIPGTTLQRLFLARWLNKSPKPRVHILLIHGINAYGFSHGQRPNMSRVDLNRNFFLQGQGAASNPAYQTLQDVLEPKGPATTGWMERLNFSAKIIFTYLTKGKKAILSALQGQAESSHGLFYTGSEEQPETRVVKAWIKEFIQTVRNALHIDLHTGFGERGRLHFFGSSQFSSSEQMRLLHRIFPNAQIDLGSHDDFYASQGDLVDWTWQAFPDKKIIPMVFEFGTMDSQTILGGLKSLWIGVLHNQSINYGYKNQQEQEKITQLTAELFNPPDFEWQQQVLEKGSTAIWQSLENLEQL